MIAIAGQPEMTMEKLSCVCWSDDSTFSPNSNVECIYEVSIVHSLVLDDVSISSYSTFATYSAFGFLFVCFGDIFIYAEGWRSLLISCLLLRFFDKLSCICFNFHRFRIILVINIMVEYLTIEYIAQLKYLR